ncbi:MAG: ATP-binding cassette domain-containing protein [Candidatus Paceibacterota bacterium]
MEVASKKAHAEEFIKELKDGYETMVGERGVKLSGGQRQRISIARVMLENSPMLILDEATSSLDSISENLIQRAFDEAMKNRTTIVIAHRLSTIKKMDRIIVLDKGKIVEDGTPDDLLNKKGYYFKLWQAQKDGVI